MDHLALLFPAVVAPTCLPEIALNSNPVPSRHAWAPSSSLPARSLSSRRRKVFHDQLQKQLEAKRRKIEADYHRKAEAVRQQARTGINEQGKRINDAQRKQVNQLAKSIARRDEKHQAIAGKLRSLKDDLEQLLKKLGIAYNELMKRAGEPLPVAPVVVPGDQGGKQNDLR